MNNHERVTHFCDLDGCLVVHQGDYERMLEIMEPLPGTLEKIQQWRDRGDCIIITTARKKKDLGRTMDQLAEVGIYYDEILAGIHAGRRDVINDKKSYMSETARAYNLDRNIGIATITDDE